MMTSLPLTRILRRVPFPKKYPVLHSLCPRDREVWDRIFGCRVSLNLANYIERSIYLRVFDREGLALVSEFLRPGTVFVDVGANVGFYTLLGASLVGDGGHVYAFEPSPYAGDKLRTTVAANALSNVTIEAAALGEEAGTAQMHLPATMENYTPSMVAGEGVTGVDVPVFRLDDYLEARGVAGVDLMKLDVEGYEPNVLEGARRYAEAGKIRALYCEFNRTWLERNGSSPQDLYYTLTSLGFVLARDRFDPVASFQNLLFLRLAA
jgi:FkbM family methyltransferase